MSTGLPPHMDAVPNHSADVVLPRLNRPVAKSGLVLIVGASTGGTEAIKIFLLSLPPSVPPILITQHMPALFTHSFAERLNSQCKIVVKEAEHGDILHNGHAYIAPGHSHLLLTAHGGHYACGLSQAAPVNRHRPSVDVLFRSAANVAAQNAVGIILTGMGRDGAQGMYEMHEAGAYNFAQDEASCVVFGMPREAIAMGGVDEVCALNDMASRVLAHLSKSAR